MNLSIFVGNNFMINAIRLPPVNFSRYLCSTLRWGPGVTNLDGIPSWQMSRFSAWDSRSSNNLLIILVVTGVLWCKIMKFAGCFVTFVQHLQVVQDVSSTESSRNNDIFSQKKPFKTFLRGIDCGRRYVSLLGPIMGGAGKYCACAVAANGQLG